MSLQQEGEQIFGEKSSEFRSEFRNEQDRLLNSARKHIDRACVAGIVTGLATAIPPHIGGAVIGLELVHQLVASGVDLRKHELNKRKHST